MDNKMLNKNIYLIILFVLSECEASLFCDSALNAPGTLECISIGLSDNRLSQVVDVRFTQQSTTVLLDNCRLRSLSANSLNNLDLLESLDLSNNFISFLPIGLFNSTPVLKSLDLSSNLLGVIHPDVFEPLKELTKLDLSKNAIIINKYEPTFLFSQSLKFLDISANCEIEFAELIKGLNVQVLKLSMNEIDLSNDTIKIPSFTNLILSHAKIDELPQSLIYSSINLMELDLSYNNIKEIPNKFFVNNKKMKYLNLSHNKLKDLSLQVFSTNTEIVGIDLSYNTLTQIWRQTFRSNINLMLLDLSNNLIFKIEAMSLQFLQKLHYINLSNNKLTELHINTFANNRLLEVIILDKNGLKVFPSATFDINENLKLLSMSHNGIENFPHRIVRNLYQLKTLNLASNYMSSLDSKFAHMPGLENLHVSCNNINTLEFDFVVPYEGVNVMVHLYGNPFNCKCINYILSNLEEDGNVKISKNKLLDGSAPMCIMDKVDCKDSISKALYNQWSNSLRLSSVCA